MKRITLLIIGVISTLGLFAVNPITLVSGDIDRFKQESVANVVIDDHNPTLDRINKTAEVYYKEQSEEKYAAFTSDLERAHLSFRTYFNEKKPSEIKMRFADSHKNAEYTLHIAVSLMSIGFFGVLPRNGGTAIYGTMELVDNATGETVCTLDFENVKGYMAPKFRDRAISSYRYLADWLIKTILPYDATI